jgi:hypothetical protein
MVFPLRKCGDWEGEGEFCEGGSGGCYLKGFGECGSETLQCCREKCKE